MTEQKQVTPESLYELRWVSDPQLAPDGQRVAYVEHWVEEIEKDGKKRPAYRTAVYLSEAADQRSRRLTYAAKGNDSQPRWSPDGTALAFVSTRDDDKPQIFVLNLAGGEAQQVTKTEELSEGVDSFDWHPSGTMFCFASNGHKDEDEQKREQEHDEKVYENRLPFKYDGVGLLEHRFAQIYRINRDGSQCTQLTSLSRDVSEPVWSPDGQLIAFVSQTEETPERRWVSDVFVVRADGSEQRRLTRSTGPTFNLAWQPSSAQIAYIGHERRLGPATSAKLWLVDLEGGAPRCITEDFKGVVGGVPSGDCHLGANPLRPVWDEQDRLTFTGMLEGRAGLYRVAASGGAIESINTSGLSVVSFTKRGDAIAFAGEHTTRAAEIYTSTLGHTLQRRSHAADAFFSSYAIQPAQHVRFPGADDWDLEGWLIKPAGAQEGRQYPLIVYVHGGPHLAYGNAFVHEFQVHAAAGFGIFFTNPRGSASYGEEFADAVRKRFGEKDFEDVMRAADYAAALDWVDPQRMGIMGGSYGGFMTNWAITHTNRFAAACTQRSISNLLSFAGASDIGPEFSIEEYGGLPWSDEEFLMSKSPIRYVQNVKTPTLILHQELDHRCPIEQGEQLYTALVVLGVPTKFVRFPGEGHELPRSGQPRRRVNRLHHIVDWFTRYLQP